ncbi:MAG: hypothetical protein HY774_27795 [Acidobacteria bacterium]|nr:hypothetical protein [Acidobacteriota bacterium]
MMESLIGIVLKKVVKACKFLGRDDLCGESPRAKELLGLHYTDIGQASKLFSSGCWDVSHSEQNQPPSGFHFLENRFSSPSGRDEIQKPAFLDAKKMFFPSDKSWCMMGVPCGFRLTTTHCPIPFFCSSPNDIRNLERFLVPLTLTTPGTIKTS